MHINSSGSPKSVSSSNNGNSCNSTPMSNKNGNGFDCMQQFNVQFKCTVSQGFFSLPQNQDGPKPIHLIYFNQEDKTFRVSEQAKTFLKSIKERVGVISVAGKYRTGKSFLLNRVIINKQNQGFGVGPTINPCTKGLWLWGDTLEGEYQGEKLKILLIDSEGIGAFDEDENHDTKIFLFALLLCSYFIYNSMGTIDENAINNLSLIINLSKELQIKSDILGESDPDEIAKYFPSFLWVVRDFSLRLHDQYGNQMTPKEYLEAAIQPQKGTSDQVETKNRIRRLVKHFFKERDCFTLVRPVEEEKQLQSLQSMPDNMLRSEFVQAVNQLRQKIFKRVKPKTLNSKFLTGEMLLELCYSYTQAVNTGSVPNIQNAWSYVCQNECQRAIQEAIENYDAQMRKVGLVQSKQLQDEKIIKNHHKTQRDIAVQAFKAKAVGQEIQEYENHLREGLSKKYKDIRAEFNRFCQQKAKEILDEELTQIKRNIQNDVYQTMDEFLSQLEKIKTVYNSRGPQFSGKSQLFIEITQPLILKTADFLAITSKKEVDVNLKILKEKLDEMERERIKMKQEYTENTRSLQKKVQILEQEKHESIRMEKLLEERLRYANEERERIEKSLSDKHRQTLEEKSSSLSSIQQKLHETETALKQKEDEVFKQRREYEKLQALIEQKLQLTENELADYKNKYIQKDQEYKSVNKDLYQAKKELQQLNQQMSNKELEWQDEIRKMQDKFDKEKDELMKNTSYTGEGGRSNQEDQWNRERMQMQVQMKMLTETMEQQKKMQESLLLALSNNSNRNSSPDKKSESKYKEKNKELLTTNQNLSQQIVQMQQKQSNLEKMISNLKQFKFMIHYALALQCKTCNRLYPKSQYSGHLPQCQRENEQRMSTLMNQNINPIEVMIINCFRNGEIVIYELQVDKNCQSWMVKRKLNEFKLIFEELCQQYPTYQLPYIPDEWLKSNNDEFYSIELRKKLQMFLVDMVRMPFIRDSMIFRQFLDVDANYIDDSNEYDPARRTMQSMGVFGGYQLNSLTLNTSNMANNRNSVLNPFSSQNIQTNNMIMVNHAKTLDGRKSVAPVMNSGSIGNSNNFVNDQRASHLYQNQNNQIQELVEDEDYSSMASNNRISQLLQQDDMMSSHRPSVFSVKNQEIKVAEASNSRGNSPFQHVDVNLNAQILGQNQTVKQSYSNKKPSNQFMLSDSENPSLVNSAAHPGAISITEDHQDFEDSFNNDMSDISISSKKIALMNEDDLFSHRTKQEENNVEGNSEPVDFSKTRSNLIMKFEQESTQPVKKITNRYDKNIVGEFEEDEEDFMQCQQLQMIDDDDELQRE